MFTSSAGAAHSFTVLVHGGSVFIGVKGFTIGQCRVDILNLKESILDKLGLFRLLKPCLQKNRQRCILRAGEVERCLGCNIVLPVYRDLRMDKASNYHTFEGAMANRAKRTQIQNTDPDGDAVYQWMLASLVRFADNLCGSCQQTPPWL